MYINIHILKCFIIEKFLFFTIVRGILHPIVEWISFEIISRRFVHLVSMFLVSDIFKGICLRQAYILSLDSHCMSLTTT